MADVISVCLSMRSGLAGDCALREQRQHCETWKPGSFKLPQLMHQELRLRMVSVHSTSGP